MQQRIRLCIFMEVGEGHFSIWGGNHLERVAHISSIRIVIIASQKKRNGNIGTGTLVGGRTQGLGELVWGT